MAAPPTADVPLQHVDIEVAGEGIAASFRRPAGASAGIVFIHDGDGRQDPHAECIGVAAANGFAGLAFDLPGHPDDCGQHDGGERAGDLETLLRMYDWLQEQGLKRIGLVGAGHGAHLAAIASGLRRVRWLVLRAPALCPDREGRPRKDEPAGAVDVGNDTQRMHAPEDSEALAACARFEGHALIVESGRDEVIPHAAITSYEQAFPRAASMTRETLDGADHELSEPRHRLAFAKKLGDWLRATSRDSTGACPDESVVA